MEKYMPPLVSKFSWFSQHSRILRVGMEPPFQRYRTHFPEGTNWGGNLEMYWLLRTFLPSLAHQRILETSRRRILSQDLLPTNMVRILSRHLEFLLEKSAHSDNNLSLVRCKVFRFGYLHRNLPIYMKKAIFALVRYIQRVTGEGAEVRVCESV